MSIIVAIDQAIVAAEGGGEGLMSRIYRMSVWFPHHE